MVKNNNSTKNVELYCPGVSTKLFECTELVTEGREGSVYMKMIKQYNGVAFLIGYLIPQNGKMLTFFFVYFQ